MMDIMLIFDGFHGDNNKKTNVNNMLRNTANKR